MCITKEPSNLCLIYENCLIQIACLQLLKSGSVALSEAIASITEDIMVYWQYVGVTMTLQWRYIGIALAWVSHDIGIIIHISTTSLIIIIHNTSVKNLSEAAKMRYYDNLITKHERENYNKLWPKWIIFHCIFESCH